MYIQIVQNPRGRSSILNICLFPTFKYLLAGGGGGGKCPYLLRNLYILCLFKIYLTVIHSFTLAVLTEVRWSLKAVLICIFLLSIDTEYLLKCFWSFVFWALFINFIGPFIDWKIWGWCLNFAIVYIF